MKTSCEKKGFDKYDVMMKILEIIELDIESRTDDVLGIQESPAKTEVAERSESGENDSYETVSDLEEAIYEMCTNSHIRQIMEISFKKIWQMIRRKEFISRILAFISSAIEHL